MKTTRVPLIVCTTSALIFALVATSFLYIIQRSDLNTRPAKAQSGDVSWKVFDGGVDDPGANYNEPYLNTSNVSRLAKLWEVTLPANADNAPVEEANVSTAQGVMDLVFINTVKGNLVAYNASSGAKVWEADPSAANYNGQGTKSSPAIDPSGNYIYAYALDGYVHRYNITNGAEVAGGGFPAQVTLLPNDTEKGSASINIANGYLYMTLSGNDGDYGHYVGHVVAINLSSGAKTVWNAECANITQLLTSDSAAANYCSNNMSGIWARPGVKVDPVTGNVFVATGNGLYDANGGGNDWGDSIVELNPNLTSIVDSYTPASYSTLDTNDADLGSTAPAILPKQSSSNTPYMLVQGGKDNIVRLLNRSNLSGASGPRHTGGELQTISISNEVHEQPAVWVDGGGTAWVFVTDESYDLYAYKVVTAGGASSLSQAYHVNEAASSPFIANGVMYLTGDTVLAINATTGAELFNSGNIGIYTSTHWESPTVVNGIVFTSDGNGHLLALYVPGVSPTPGPAPAPAPSPTSSGGSSSGSSKTTTSTSTATKTATPTTTNTATTSTSKSTNTAAAANHAAATQKRAPSFLGRVATILGLRKVNALLHGNRIAEGVLFVIFIGSVAASGLLIRRTLLRRMVSVASPGNQMPLQVSVMSRLQEWVGIIRLLLHR